MDSHLSDSVNDSKSGSKTPVVRGARACTVCRAAKMKCVGAEDGQKQCQRCKRANVDCIFEKHRRGRKPGSKLSEASKMLRRLERGLNSAKMKSQSSDPGMSSAYQGADSRHGILQDSTYNVGRSGDNGYGVSNSQFTSNEMPQPMLSSYQNGGSYADSSTGSRTIMDLDDDNEDPDRNDEVFPAQLILRENQRNSFFRTILNPKPEDVASESATPNRSNSLSPPSIARNPNPSSVDVPCDPITAGLMDENEARVIFDAVFLRLNPFINLFDAELHSVPYVRSKCPFLFTTLLMAGCKFFKPELFKQCQKMANDLAVRAFSEQWKRVEVVQAFACLTYWKDPDDNRTWTYIGYACRMATEIGLNRYVAQPSPHESDFQKLERRNRERTYLVLFVHDRSLSTQTGRHWMLPEDDLIHNSSTWHEQGLGPTRPEDVIVAAFVALRHFASETTDVFNAAKGSSLRSHTDINYETILRQCNTKLTQWDETWRREMERANGEKFHLSFLSFFRLYVRLFLNSFAIQSSVLAENRHALSVHAFSACYTSALDSLRIVSTDFASMSMLRYGQDSITVMTAYSAIILLNIGRFSKTQAQLTDENINEIHALVTKTADAYHDASLLSPASTSAAYHARFLRTLLIKDIKIRQNERRDSGMPIDPRLQGPPNSLGSFQGSQVYVHPTKISHEQPFHFSTPSHHLPQHTIAQEPQYHHAEIPTRNGLGNTSVNLGSMNHQHNGYPAVHHQTSDLDECYWKNMFIELGFGGEGEPPLGKNDLRNMPYAESHLNQVAAYHHHIQTSAPNYGH